MELKAMVSFLSTIILVGIGCIIFVPDQANAAYVQITRTLEYTGEDHEISTGTHCDFSFVQNPWNTNSININNNDENVVYLYARCRVWNDNNYTNDDPTKNHNMTLLSYDVWFYLNDPNCQGSYVDYYSGSLIRYNYQDTRAWKITPFHVYQNLHEGDILTIKWELNILARSNDMAMMDTTYTSTTVSIHMY